MEVHALCGPALVRGQQAVRRPVDLPDQRPRPVLELRAKLLRQFLRSDERHLERPLPPRVDTELVRLVAQELQERGGPRVPGHGELRQDLRLDVGALRPRRDHRASRRRELLVDAVPTGREVVAERVQHDVVLPEPHGVERQGQRRLSALGLGVAPTVRRVEVGAR